MIQLYSLAEEKDMKWVIVSREKMIKGYQKKLLLEAYEREVRLND